MDVRDRRQEQHVLAREELRRAVDSVPLPTVRRYRAQAAAERVLEGSFRNRYPQLFEAPQENRP